MFSRKENESSLHTEMQKQYEPTDPLDATSDFLPIGLSLRILQLNVEEALLATKRILTSSFTGFPQVRHNKIPGLFPDFSR